MINYRQIITSLLAIGAMTIASSSFAKSLNLYEQPNASSKLVETIDSKSGLITIYSPKESEWIKVANPRNGNVGWIKANDLNGDSKFSVNFITTGDSPHGYQIIQFGNTKLSTEQMQSAVKQLEVQQQTIQKEMQKMMQNILSNSQWRFPLIMPVMVVPEKAGVPVVTPSVVKPIEGKVTP